LTLGNVNNNSTLDDTAPFIRASEVAFLKRHRAKAFEVMVACHELLGHGSGRLLTETSPGVYNFDAKSPPVNPLTGEAIRSWYKPGETWQSIFGTDAASYEECRADGVGLFLVCHKSILKIFGYAADTPILAEDSEYRDNSDLGSSLLIHLWSPTPDGCSFYRVLSKDWHPGIPNQR
jgi:dipeptidyl-peptidase-3